MFVIICTLLDAVFLSITHFRRQVESHLQVGGRGNLLHQLQLGPSELPDSPDVPQFVLKREFGLQNDCVMCPADGHSLRHYL